MSSDTTFAFPVTPEIWATHHDFCGMTLRDYFAAAALPSCFALTQKHVLKTGKTYDFAKSVAQDAYDMADAMLAARQEQSK